MAKLSSDKQYVTVEKYDTLWKIAKKYLGAGKKYQTLVTINAIANPNKICVGQKIYLYKKTAPSTKKKVNNNVVIIKAFGLQSNTENTLYVAWNWSKSKTESYAVEWTYATGDGIWFVGSSGTNSVDENNPDLSKQSTYSMPDNAIKVRVRVKPISKKKSDNKTYEWTSKWSSYQTYEKEAKLATPGVPDVKIEKYKLTATLENISIPGATKIEFEVYKDKGKSAYKNGKAAITSTKSVSYKVTVDAGGEYRVRCRAIKGAQISEWSEFSNPETTIPAATAGFTAYKALTETSVYLEWKKSSTAKTYDIEYTTNKSYFDSSDQVLEKNGLTTTHCELFGLESGKEYFFRVRAVNEQGESSWSSIVSLILGGKPSAPTTWSSTTTCITGEELKLYWIHNTTDGSNQTYSELEIISNGSSKIHSLKGSGIFKIDAYGNAKLDEEFKDDTSTDEDESVKTNYCIVDTTGYIEGTQIQWRVRTAGITKSYGEWSVQRTVDIYAPATLELSLTDANENAIETITSFPFYIYGLPGPNTQTPLSYHVTIVTNEGYETIDDLGHKQNINAGDEVYSQYFDTSSALLLELLPNSVNLDNNISYTVTCIVSMDSGLTAESSIDFTVSWTDERYEPNAAIGYDPETYVTSIRPYCMDSTITYHTVELSDEGYIVTSDTLDEETLDDAYTETEESVLIGTTTEDQVIYYCGVYVDADAEENMIEPIYYLVNYNSGVYTITDEVVDISTIAPVYTTTGEEVLVGATEDGTVVHYAVTEEEFLLEDVTLSVYRREFDGSFVEIETGINNMSNTVVIDPHPALDYARYRIIAISNTTGAVSYYDVPVIPIGEHAVIIQWDEEWTNYDTDVMDETYQPPWTGSLLRLPYNIDVTDSNSPDVAHIEYAGRKHPVSYYGTHLGTSQSWNVDIEASDKETLYAIRRLMNWMGDVYVREPSGSGFWANIKVNFSQKHRELTIPVSFDITRVEGGK